MQRASKGQYTGSMMEDILYVRKEYYYYYYVLLVHHDGAKTGQTHLTNQKVGRHNRSQ